MTEEYETISPGDLREGDEVEALRRIFGRAIRSGTLQWTIVDEFDKHHHLLDRELAAMTIRRKVRPKPVTLEEVVESMRDARKKCALFWPLNELLARYDQQKGSQ